MTYRAKEHYRDPAVAASYDAERFTTRKGRFVDRRELALVADAVGRAGVNAGARILDVPCGTGRLVRALVDEGYVVTGADVSEAMLAKAASQFDDMPTTSRPSLVVGDAEALPFADASFDLVVSLRLFGHLPPAARARALLDFRRVSRGHVIVAFYQRGSLQELLRRRRRATTPWNPVDLVEIDADSERRAFGGPPGASSCP